MKMEQFYCAMLVPSILLELCWAKYKEEYAEELCYKKSVVQYTLGHKKQATALVLRATSKSTYSPSQTCTINVETDSAKERLKMTIAKIDFGNIAPCINSLLIKAANKTYTFCNDSSKKVDIIPFSTKGVRKMSITYNTNVPLKNHTGFELIVTAYKTGTCDENYDFSCEDYCITYSLLCDGYDNCGNNLDELYNKPSYCMDPDVLRKTIIYGAFLFIVMVSATIWFVWKERSNPPVTPPYCCSSCPGLKGKPQTEVTEIPIEDTSV